MRPRYLLMAALALLLLVAGTASAYQEHKQTRAEERHMEATKEYIEEMGEVVDRGEQILKDLEEGRMSFEEAKEEMNFLLGHFGGDGWAGILSDYEEKDPPHPLGQIHKYYEKAGERLYSSLDSWWFCFDDNGNSPTCDRADEALDDASFYMGQGNREYEAYLNSLITPPEAAFTYEQDGIDVTVNAETASSPNGHITSYQWSWGDGSPKDDGRTASHTYDSTGHYEIVLTVTDSEGYTGEKRRIVNIQIPDPEAQFSLDVYEDTIRVDASESTAYEDDIEEYNWTWKAGESESGDERERHTYEEAGEHRIQLTVHDAYGQTASIIKTAIITTNLTADFTYYPQEPDNTDVVEFEEDADLEFGHVTDRNWTLGDQKATGESVETTFERAGNHTVQLLVRDNYGDARVETKTVHVTCGALTAWFSISQNGEFVTADARDSCSPDGNITEYRWEWGDGSTSTGLAAEHTYDSPGNYTLRLNITTEEGQTASTTQTIEVSNFRPVLSLPEIPSNLTTQDTAEIAPAFQDPDGGPVEMNWTVYREDPRSEDPIVSQTGSTFRHSFTDHQEYNVRVRAVNEAGAYSTANTTISISNAAPTGSIEIEANPQAGRAVTFEASYTDPDGNITSYAWDFGDGNQSEEQRVQYTYAAGDNYTVELTVTDDDGDTTVAERSIDVAPKDTVGFSTLAVFVASTVAAVAARGGFLSGERGDSW